MMADGDEPERIFQQAISLLKAQQILKEKKTDDHDEVVALVMTTSLLQAFTIELLLKCLIRVEGGTPPRDHDLLDLFNLLSAPTRERLEAMWRGYVQSQPAETTEPFEQIGVTIEPELTSALAAGRRAFQRIRYLHEEPGEDFVFYLGALPKMLFEVAFELRPDWAQEGLSAERYR
jgi:hypothetical protein